MQYIQLIIFIKETILLYIFDTTYTIFSTSTSGSLSPGELKEEREKGMNEE